MKKGIRHGSAALLVTAVAGVLCAAAAQARGSDVRISAPTSLIAGKPCRVTVVVSAGIRGTALLQEQTRGRWRTVSSARLRRHSVKLRCPTVNRSGSTRHFRALVRQGMQTIARSRTVAIRNVPAPVAPPVVVPAPPPGPAPQPPGPDPGLPPTPVPLDPAQFGVEGTGGPPTPQALALLTNQNVVLDADGVADISAGRIDPRIIAVLTTLSRAHRITVSAMCTDHAKFTTGGSVSNHYYGRGVDIAAVDGVLVNAANATAYDVAAGLSSLDPSYRPDEVGTPWTISAPGYFTGVEFQDNIHVAFKQLIDPWWLPPA